MSRARFPFLAVLGLLPLAGCAEPDLPGDGGSPPATVPAWSVGQAWSYLRDNGEDWLNQTVVSVEEKGGLQTYFVRSLKTNTSNTEGNPVQLDWHEVGTLGIVAHDEGMELAIDCESGFWTQIFPLEDVRYTCTIRSSAGFEQTASFWHHVGEWSTMRTPAGDLQVVELWTYFDGGHGDWIDHGWYSPEAENYARVEYYTGQNWNLVAWSKPG